jgi:parallel beta-helix repeat protein
MDKIIRVRLVALVLGVVLGVAVACRSQVIYVDGAATGANDGSAWADAYANLQDALAAAASAEKPVEVRVARGVYKPDQGAGVTAGDRAATFQLLNGVTTQGGYAGAGGPDPDARDVELYRTILSGDLAGNDVPSEDSINGTKDENSYFVVTGSGTDGTAVIDGFTITGGYTVRAIWLGVEAGVGLWIDAGSPTILNCCFTANCGRVAPGALSATNGSNPTVSNCTFLDNQGRGVCNWRGSNAVLTNCRFEGNADEAIRSIGGSPVITDCSFRGNGEYRIYLYNCDAVLAGCTFEGSDQVKGEGIHGVQANLSLTDCVFNGWGIDAWDSNAVVTNCAFRGSACQCCGGKPVGLGIYSSASNLTLTDCTFTDLHAEMAGGILAVNGELNLLRCAFAGNSGGSGGAIHRIGTLQARECAFIGNGTSHSTVGAISGTDDVELYDCEFIGNIGQWWGAIDLFDGAWGDGLKAVGCLFTGNSGRYGAASIEGSLLLSNCTFAGNRGRLYPIDYHSDSPQPAVVTQCIIWDTGAFPWWDTGGYITRRPDSVKVGTIDVTYSDVRGGCPGQGNLDVDPCFVSPGYWDPNGTPDDPNDDVWVAGDYHLKSQAGHWDRAAETWVQDEITSPCIDAGDPNSPVGDEPQPNGGRINLGAYGGTEEASKSYLNEPVSSGSP